MRKLLLLAVLLCGFLSSFSNAISLANAQATLPREWTWVSGSNTNLQHGVYGTLQAPAPGNVPGARQWAMGWTDKNGNLWLFGGWGLDVNGTNGYLNDLWMFTPSTMQWIWISGSSTVPTVCGTNPFCGQSGVYGGLQTPTSGNVPGGRYGAATWTDMSGNLWLFGGQGYDSAGNFGFLNDFWEFNTSTDQWVWMGGSSTIPDTGGEYGVYGTLGQASPSNIPGSRSGAMSWTDGSGNLWMLGGGGYDSQGIDGDLNDLWQFDPSTSEWTWQGGRNTIVSSGVYGTLGIPSPTNSPGARSGGVSWIDSNGNLWLFGGAGLDSLGDSGDLNDVWKFSLSTGEWTWMGGNNVIPYATGSVPLGTSGVYGTQGTPVPANIPGSRVNPVGWADSNGNLWLFGGEGFDKDDIGTYNDLWAFNPVDNEWAWVGGSDTTAGTASGPTGVYGTLGIAAATNVPGGRSGAVSWTDNKGNLWLFGGNGYDAKGDYNFLNDLWEYSPSAPAFPPSFIVSVNPASVTVALDNSGGSGTTTINTSIAGGFSSSIALTASGQPDGVSISFSPDSISGAGTSTMTLDVSSTVAMGSYPITITATGGGITQSTVVTLVVSGTAMPILNPVPGNYATAQTVSISDSTPGATIYYTTDETVPTTSSTVYSGPITVSSSETIAAIAVARGYTNSPITIGKYTIGPVSSLGAWMWMGGSSNEDQIGEYGSLDGPTLGNIPGARSGAVTWTDSNNNLWLFGGYGFDANRNLGYLNDMWRYIPGSKEWAWMRGSSTVPCTTTGGVTTCSGQPGVYGIQGAFASSNTPGGRNGGARWIDSSGHLWLFGGYGTDANGSSGYLNDLWEFDPVTDEWAWMGGSSSSGQQGVFGTLGTPAPGNIPWGRTNAASWTDNQGNFWLFGGGGVYPDGADVLFNDVWEFNPSYNQWTWMGGSNYVDILAGYVPGVYGTLGVPAPENIPGSRSGAATWTDSSGNLWMFGGYGGINGQFNDLWKFNPTTDEWAWMSGANTANCIMDPFVGYNACTSEPGIYGTLGVPAAGNVPPGGTGFASWTDNSGNFWLFGGAASDITGQNGGFYQGIINDLWVFNPSSNQWTWMGGDFATSNCSFLFLTPLPFTVCDGSQGDFGTLQVSDAGNNPLARTTPASWTDKNGNFWLFSGAITDLSDFPGYLNDLWEYQPSTTSLPAATTPIFSLKPGVYTSGGPLMISNGMANAKIYYTTDGTAPTFASTPYTGQITISPPETVRAIAVAPGYRDSAVASANYIFPSTPPAPTFSVASGTYTSTQTVTISDTTPGVTIFYTTDGTAPTSSSLVYKGPITVSSSEAITAIATVHGYFVYDGIAADYGPYVVSAVASAAYTINLSPVATPVFSVPGGTYTAAQTVTITDPTPGATIYYTANGTTATIGSTVYSGPITVSSSETLEAIATVSGYSNSAIASAAYTINVPAPDFSVADSPASLTVTAGQSGTSTISITPLNGFNSSVSFSCSGLPAGASCSFSPATVTPSSAAASTTLKVTSSTTTAALRHNSIMLIPGSTLAVVLCCFGGKKRRPRQLFFLLAVSLAGLCLLDGCGGTSVSGNSSSSPQLVTSNITVTATSGTLQHAVVLSFTVN